MENRTSKRNGLLTRAQTSDVGASLGSIIKPTEKHSNKIVKANTWLNGGDYNSNNDHIVMMIARRPRSLPTDRIVVNFVDGRSSRRVFSCPRFDEVCRTAPADDENHGKSTGRVKLVRTPARPAPWDNEPMAYLYLYRSKTK